MAVSYGGQESVGGISRAYGKMDDGFGLENKRTIQIPACAITAVPAYNAFCQTGNQIIISARAFTDDEVVLDAPPVPLRGIARSAQQRFIFLSSFE